MVRNNKWTKLLAIALSSFALLTFAQVAVAGERDQAFRIFNRLNGVPPTAAELDQMEALIKQGKMKDAALAAINSPAGNFYNLTLKNAIAKWTNVDLSPRVSLNDYTATVIGMIRDDIPFTQALYDDIVYVGEVQGVTLPAYSVANNTHYEQIEAQNLPLHTALVKKQQSALTPALVADATAGLLTTRAFGAAFYNAGTNRRALKFTMSTFLCKEMETLSDNTRSDFHVRRDVTRSPGGDSAQYRNVCAGCHSGMDALGGAFAFYDFDDTAGLVFSPGTVRPKYNRNATEFPDGFVTTDDTWQNLWIEGHNATQVGWQGATSGKGLKEFGKMVSQADAFSQCMADHVFQTVCLHKADPEEDGQKINDLAASFKQSGSNMKQIFAEAVTMCPGE